MRSEKSSILSICYSSHKELDIKAGQLTPLPEAPDGDGQDEADAEVAVADCHALRHVSGQDQDQAELLHTLKAGCSVQRSIWGTED